MKQEPINMHTDVPVLKQRAGNLSVYTYANRVVMGEDAADMVCKTINHLHKQQEFVNIIFAAAPSQSEFFAALLEKKTVDWRRVNAFHMDEYIELPENDSRKFASFLKGNIFDKLNFHSINYINGNATDIGAECSRYAGLLAQYPTDIVCMGIGENGHLAFNDPPVADFEDPLMVKMVKLDAPCRQQQVNDGCFADLSEVPAYAITLTIPALMTGKYTFCIVPGQQKAEAVYNTLYAEIIEKYPSTILRRQRNAVLFLDKNSASRLQNQV